MPQRKHYLRPDLIKVEERPDLRRSVRVVPGNIAAELAPAGPSSQKGGSLSRECHCLNLSPHGIAVLCDNHRIAPGDRVRLNLSHGSNRMNNLTGAVVRTEPGHRFTRLAIEFDHQHFTHPLFQAILGR
ncbi:PilZ domain-containing protein [Marinobacter sp.]|uniref:PilZ domain-containing protein n=1 Tax=Marinobacter sp. TaxID=50741 RepID=UPI0035645A28